VNAENAPTIRFATGTHVYKYSSLEYPERLKKILLEHELYVPTRDQLNDPADARPVLPEMSNDELLYFVFYRNFNPTLPSSEQRRIIEMLQRNIEHQGSEAYRRTMTEMLHKLQEGYRIYSLSKRYNNMGMWAKYAKDRSGYCLEFARENRFFERAVEVFYGDIVPLDMSNPRSYFFYCKRSDWSGEEEVRVVLMPGSDNPVKIEPGWLTRLILGEKISTEQEELIRGWANERQPELVVVKAHFDSVSQILLLR
jgi:hypothetical protein